MNLCTHTFCRPKITSLSTTFHNFLPIAAVWNSWYFLHLRYVKTNVLSSVNDKIVINAKNVSKVFSLFQGNLHINLRYRNRCQKNPWWSPEKKFKIFQAFRTVQTATQRYWNVMKRLCCHPHHDRNRNHAHYIMFSSQNVKVAACLKLPFLRKYRGYCSVIFFS